MRFFNRVFNAKNRMNLAVIAAGTIALEGFKEWDRSQRIISYKQSQDEEMDAFPHLKDIDSLINQAFYDMGTVKPDVYYNIKPLKIIESSTKPVSFEENVYYLVTQPESLTKHPDVQGWPCLLKRPQQSLEEKYIALKKGNGSYQDSYTPETSQAIKQFLLGINNFSSTPMSIESSLFAAKPRVIVDGFMTMLPPAQIYAVSGHEAIHHLYKHDLLTSISFSALLRVSYNFLNTRNLSARFLIIFAIPPIQLFLTHTLQLAQEIQADIESTKKLNTAGPLIDSHRVFAPMQSKRWQDKIQDPHLTPERRINYLSYFTTSKPPLLFQSSIWHEQQQRQALQSAEEQALKNVTIFYGTSEQLGKLG